MTSPIPTPTPRLSPDSSFDAAAAEGLISDLKARDPAALDRALSLYWSHAVAYAARLVDRVEDAKDIAQDAFLHLWEGAARWDVESEVRAILFGIIRNLALKEHRHRSVRASHAVMARHSTQSRAASPADEAIAREFEAAIREAVESLPERRREVFMMSRRDGMTHKEIAKRLGISAQTVANQLSSALGDLRHTLQPFLHRSPPKPDLRVIPGMRQAK